MNNGFNSLSFNRAAADKCNRWIFRILVAVCAVVLSALTAAAQEADSSSQEYPTLRIVSPDDVDRKPALPARIALAPFDSVGGKLERGLYLVEEKKVIDRLAIILSDPHLRPLFGSLGDGSGLGAGVAFSTLGIHSDHFGIIGSFQATAKKYVEASAGTRLQSKTSKLGLVTLDVTAGYKLRPEEDFWGIGADPGTTRSNFNLQERSAGARLEVAPFSGFRSGTEIRYSSTSIFAGEDPDFPTTASAFGTALPGLAGAELWETSLFAEYDARGGQNAPAKGFYVMGKVSSINGAGNANFGYWHYEFDQRLYVPLASDRRVLAIRTLAIFNDAKGDAQIPFFRLARLGNTQTLRGYDGDRFYARNAAAWNVEYRTDLTGGLGAFAFTDFGQVFDRVAEFNRRNFRVTYGGGLQFKAKKSVFFRTFLARSDEGTRLMFSFGPTF